ncbi:hypothetical protein ACMWP9_33865, partial [Escherichia coli]
YKTHGEQWFGSAAVQGNYQKAAAKVGPRFSALVGGKLFDDTLGVYLSGLKSREYQNEKQILSYPAPVNIGIQQADGTTQTYNNIL